VSFESPKKVDNDSSDVTGHAIASIFCSVVCLSVVCHSFAPCLRRSTDLNVNLAVWPVSSDIYVNYEVLARRDFRGRTLSQNM